MTVNVGSLTESQKSEILVAALGAAAAMYKKHDPLQGAVGYASIDRLAHIRPVVHPKSLRDQVKSVVPEPDECIVKRLIGYYSGTNYQIRLPWATTPNTNQYDLENVKFFARILTMLDFLEVHPPPRLQSQGGFGSCFLPSFRQRRLAK